MAGYVEVSRADIRRLAKALGLSVPQFEEKHIVQTTRKREKLIKSGYDTCQFLAPDRTCTVYEARPKNCRGYVCWDQDDTTVYDYAKFFQLEVGQLRALEEPERASPKRREAAERQVETRKRSPRRG